MAVERVVERYATAADFLADAKPFLLAAEADNNLLLSIAELLTTDDHPFRDPLYLATVKERGHVVGCAICAPPDGLELGVPPDGVPTHLVDSVAATHPTLGSVSGSRDASLEFAREWTRVRGGSSKIRYRWQLFRLETAPIPPRPVQGRLRCARQDDWPLLASWAPRYAADVNAPVDVVAFFRRMLRRQTLYVWDHDGPRCVVAESGITQSGARIAAVYTPDEFRARGYASNAVAAVSERALARGSKFCVLFAEHVPGRLYRSIGYLPVREHCLIDLGA
jgi:hypothetical protein